jgi:poly(A) polymerase
LAALLPADPDLAGAIAARLRLSNKQRKRLEMAAGRAEPAPDDPRQLAYRIGLDAALDRLLLGPSDGGYAQKVGALENWVRPRLPLSGGELIDMGLSPGPVVAATLQAIEREWALQGFAGDAAAVRRLARRHVDQLLRSSQ